uniref:DELLA protein n=1 Tax=Fagopyrum tataricum TaxID=62330 RepID=A0A2U8JD00_FAGTA|nr:DELLA3 [Fagopyrum tataricum]
MESHNLQPMGSTSSSPTPDSKPPELDTQLATAGYRVRNSDLRHVAQHLERLENAMLNTPFDFAGDDLVHYNPSDTFSWVESLLPEPVSDTTYLDPYPSTDATWTDQIAYQPVTVVSDMEENSGIRLVHLLLTCAESVQRGDISLAVALLNEMKILLKQVNTTCGIGKVAGYFIDALFRRIYRTPGTVSGGFDHEILYHHFYEACPYLKFAHFTANQAILEAFNGHDRVHVIDFNLMQGLQWPPLIQALALRPGGSPFLTLTGIGPPESVHEVGLKLGHLARSVNVRFAFHGIAATQLKDIHVDSDEAVAVNSITELHRVLGSEARDMARPSAIDLVLGWIKALNPKIFTMVEQEANHNGPGYLDRFTEALHYYPTMFDSMEACQLQPEKALAEIYIQREICNIVSCEGSNRIERHESLARWRVRLNQAGFKPLHLGSNALKQASMLLTLFSAKGYCVEENEGCLTLGWHNRPLTAASAWKVGRVARNSAET